MEILGVSCKAVEGGIQLPNIDAVKNALRCYVQHSPQRSHTRRLGDGSPFMTELFRNVERTAQGFKMHHAYTDNGMGAFDWTTVSVQRIAVGNNASYLLRLIRVGNDLTGRLATTLERERVLYRDHVDVEFQASGDRFMFDFKDIAARLRRAVPKIPASSVLAERVVNRAVTSEDAVIRDDDVLVVVAISTMSVVGPSFHGDRWERNNSIVTGPLMRHHDSGRRYVNPVLTFMVMVPGEAPYETRNYESTSSPAIKRAIHSQADAIVAAFK